MEEASGNTGNSVGDWIHTRQAIFVLEKYDNFKLWIRMIAERPDLEFPDNMTFLELVLGNERELQYASAQTVPILLDLLRKRAGGDERVLDGLIRKDDLEVVLLALLDQPEDAQKKFFLYLNLFAGQWKNIMDL